MTDVGLALPFSLGIVTAINPCGFAMLPTWRGYFIGRDTADQQARPEQVIRGLWVSLLLTVSFVAVFGLLGLAVSHLVSEEAIARRTSWITVVVGLALIPYGLTLLTGRRSSFSLLRPTRGPRSTEAWSVLGFGVSYAVVSVGCAAPLFLLHVAGSFSRDGIVGGTAVYLAFAAGMVAVVTSLTLSLALARGGLARNLRRLLPFTDRIGALQSHLTAWTTEVGGLRVGLALWMVIMTFVAWGLDPALDRRARTSLRAVVFGAWVLVEGLSHRGDLVVVPTLRIVAGWPDRVSGWFDNPSRWAVPLEVLLTATVLLAVVLNASALLRKRHR